MHDTTTHMETLSISMHKNINTTMLMTPNYYVTQIWYSVRDHNNLFLIILEWYLKYTRRSCPHLQKKGTIFAAQKIWKPYPK